MIEPFTALGVASSIIQFVDFGSRLLIEGYGIYRSRDGATKDHLNIEELVSEKKALMERLSMATSADGRIGTPDDTAVQMLAARCCSLAQELLELLQELKLSPNARFRAWESLRQAARQGRKASKIRRLRNQLQEIHVEINTLLLNVIKYASLQDLPFLCYKTFGLIRYVQ